MEIDNDFLMKMDTEAFLYISEKDVNLSTVSFLDFRKFLYKKYYNEEDEDDTIVALPALEEGHTNNCPSCGSMMTWVCLGEPEGDLYKCEKCDGEFDKDLNDIISANNVKE